MRRGVRTPGTVPPVNLVHFLRRLWRHPSNRGRRLRSIARAAWWELRGAPAREIRLYGGLRFRCEPGSGVARGLVGYGGRPEYHEMGLVAHLLRPGDRFVDVGANAGYYSVLAAGCVGPAGAVEAFEPSEPARGRLLANIALNALSNVRVHPVALAESAGTARFVADRDTENRLASGQDGDTPTVEVPTATLDAALGDLPCALGKIDVEGAEGRVLAGAERALADRRPPVWILEAGKRLAAFGGSPEALVAWLSERGYEAGLYDADRRAFTFGGRPWDSRPNIVAVARDRRGWAEERVRER